MTNTRRIAYIALLTAIAILLSYFERSIPSFFWFAPGTKIGLGNIVTLVGLFTLPYKDAVLLTVSRLLLASLLLGNLSLFLYSALGTLLSFMGMSLFKLIGNRYFSFIGISVLGGALHNLGQLIVASMIAQTFTVLLYLPVLTFFGILSGFAVGLIANYFMKRIRPIQIMFLEEARRSVNSANWYRDFEET